MEKIAIIGAGSFGTTLALLLGEKNFPVALWARRKEIAQEINTSRTNSSYLPGISLPPSITSSSSLGECIIGSRIVVFAVPSAYLRMVVHSCRPFFSKDMIIMHVIKGIEDSGKLMSQVLSEEIPFPLPIAALSGPNHAEEISLKLPTATVIASSHKKAREHLCEVFQTPYFKTYPHDDIIGIEICGAVKNIIALAIGVCDGLQFGDNAKGSILTLGLNEMGAISTSLGAKRSTCFGLAGTGDLVATCFSKHSRNRSAGEMLAKGKSIEEVRKEMHGMVAEGIRNAKIAFLLCQKHHIHSPLITQTYRVLYEGINIKKGIEQLLAAV